jgi:UDP:flavonoid glycosyltransferase YjiC (YdhE family)
VRVLFASTRGPGHFNPLVPFIESALRAGHEVMVAGPPSLAETVEGAGYGFWPGDAPPEEELGPAWARVPTVSPDEANEIVIGEIFGRLNVRAMLPSLRAAVDEWRPDLVIHEQAEFASAIAAELGGVPHARLGVSLGALDGLSLRIARTALEEQHAGIAELIWRSPYLTLFPASLEDPEAEQPPDTHRFRDPGDPVSGEPLPDWWEGDERPLVYVSFGSVAGGMPMAGALFGGALQAAADLPARVLLTVGHELDLEGLGPAPPNLHVERWVPQADVFGHASVVVTHGGSGTTLGALAAGLPLIVVPLFADQPDNARRVAAVGAGVVTEPDGMREAIETVLGEAKFTRAAQRLAQEIAWLPPTDAAFDGELLRGAARRA